METYLESVKVLEIVIGDPLYPSQLLELDDPPEQLYIRGNYNKDIFLDAFAVIGSRKMTPYGKEIVDQLVPYLVKNGATIISGFMYGIDTAAHNSTIKSGGETVAVLGCGLNHIYPRENASLYKEIIESGGFILSEYPPDFGPTSWTFPKRNRIVAALAQKGSIVVEAAEHSGTLITATYADTLNRPLYAFPGPISSMSSSGANKLIKNKIAKMILKPEDIKI